MICLRKKLKSLVKHEFRITPPLRQISDGQKKTNKNMNKTKYITDVILTRDRYAQLKFLRSGTLACTQTND